MSRSEDSRSRSRAAVHGDTFVSPNTPNLGSLTPHITQAWIFPDQPCFGQLFFTRMSWGYLGRLETPHKNNFPVQKHDHVAPPGPCFALAEALLPVTRTNSIKTPIYVLLALFRGKSAFAVPPCTAHACTGINPFDLPRSWP